MSGRDYVVPGENDVLCGRGRLFYEHVGNTKFRDIIEASLPGYAKAETKGEKTCFVRRVVNEISDKGGRFLKLDKSVDKWYEGDMVCAKSKVGHAFRDAIAEQQGHTVTSTTTSSSGDSDDSSDSHKTSVASGSDNSKESEVGLGASSLLLLGKAATAEVKSTNDSNETKKNQQQDRDKSSELPPILSKTSDAQLTSSETKPIEKDLPETVRSSQQKLGNLATVKKAMLKTLLLRQQALSRNNRYRKPASEVPSPARTDMESSSSPDTSGSSRASEVLQHTPVAEPSAQDAAKETRREKDVVKSLDKPTKLPDVSRGPSSASHDPSKVNSSRPASRGKSIDAQQECGGGPKLQRMPGMLDTTQLKRAMLRTLALRQQALEFQTGSQSRQSRSGFDGRTRVTDILQKAKASSNLSTTEILQQAMDAQKKSMSTNDMLKRTLAMQRGSAIQPSARDTKPLSDRPRKQKKLAHPGEVTKKDSSSRSFLAKPPILISPEAGSKPKMSVSKTINVEHLRMKRRRDSHPPTSLEKVPPHQKKQRPLSEVARENSLRRQASIGPCYPSAMGVGKEDLFYFL